MLGTGAQGAVVHEPRVCRALGAHTRFFSKRNRKLLQQSPSSQPALLSAALQAPNTGCSGVHDPPG